MKKSITCIILMSLCMLVGCESSVTETPSIGTPNIAEEKAGLISIEPILMDKEEYATMQAAGASNIMIFSINYDNVNAQNIKYWIEHYENGQLTGKILDMSSQLQDHAESKLYFSTVYVDTNNEVWTMAFRQNGTIGSGKYVNKNMDFDSTLVQQVSQIPAFDLNQTNLLGVLVRNKDRNSVGSSDDIEKTIEENKEVYILKCKIS